MVEAVVAARATSIRTGLCRKASVEPGDFRRHGRREEQRLPGEGHELADALDVGDEAHVEHTVGLVDDEDLDAGEQQLAALEEVEQAARRRDQHVGAAHDLGFLVAEGDAADQQRDIELVVDAIFGEALLDLGREFAGGFENERARHAGPGAALSSRLSIGSVKAAVLPVPVWAMPRMSRPCRAGGMACAWIGVGLV